MQVDSVQVDLVAAALIFLASLGIVVVGFIWQSTHYLKQTEKLYERWRVAEDRMALERKDNNDLLRIIFRDEHADKFHIVQEWIATRGLRREATEGR